MEVSRTKQADRKSEHYSRGQRREMTGDRRACRNQARAHWRHLAANTRIKTGSQSIPDRLKQLSETFMFTVKL